MPKNNHRNQPEVLVRKSYYTFSENYPLGTLNHQPPVRRSAAKRIFSVAAVVLTAAVFIAVGYFGAYSLLSISKQESTAEVPVEEVKSAFDDEYLRAVTLDADQIGNSEYLKKQLREIHSLSANAAVLWFKDSTGKLLYSSDVFTALGNAKFDSDTVRRAVQYFKTRGIAVIGGVCCFEDNFAAHADESMAVKYMDSNICWMDGDETPSAWLNPYSAEAVSYLSSIIGEICDFGVDALLLSSVSFPLTGDLSTATFPGEGSTARNAQLASFVKKIQKQSGLKVLVKLTAIQAFEENENGFYGSFASLGDYTAFDTAVRETGIKIDKETDFAQFISFLGNLTHIEECSPVIELNAAESNRKLLKVMLDRGYNMVIIG